MEEIINQLQIVNTALSGLEIKSSRGNLDKLLGSMQILDRVIQSVQQLKSEKRQEEREGKE